MARGVALLLLLVTLALPATADARTKSVTVRLPADGGVSFARYVVKTAKPADLTVRGARRLGTSMILTSARPLGRRRYEVTAMLVNPMGGASASQGRAFDLVFESVERAKLAVTLFGIVTSFLDEPLTGSEPQAVNQFCDRPPPKRITRRTRRGRRFFESRGGTPGERRRIRVLFTAATCPDDAATTAPATRELRERGVMVPGCVGTVRRFQSSPNEVSARMICTQSTNVLALRAPAGNDGMNCLGPPGSACAYSQFCNPLPRESVCYGDMDGFASDTNLEFRAAYAQPVQPEDISGIWVPQGSPVRDGRYAYLRYILDPPPP